jgi:hypothetical protein
MTYRVLLQRVTAWISEALVQAVAIAVLLVALYGHDRFGYVRAVGVFAVSIFMMFCISGYLLTTAVARLFWKSTRVWQYPAVAMLLFVFHFELMNIGVGGAFDPHDRHIVVVVGAWIAFSTAWMGTVALRRWSGKRIASPIA